ncbi:MAG: SH3 domain-containing protein [Aggregatilineales bacterium]
MIKGVMVSLLFVGLSLMYYPALGQTNSDCDSETLGTALSDIAEEISSASYAEISDLAEEINLTVSAYLENCDDSQVAENSTSTANSGEVLFTIQASGNVNVRSCGETTCGIVTTTADGQIFSVVGQDDDWYEIDLGDGETGFIASWLTTPGPDQFIDIYEGHVDLDIECLVQGVISRSSSNSLDFAITGEGRSEIVVDIYRANATNPEPVWRQFDKTFIDTGDPYVHQVYRSSYWPIGTYQLHLERNGEQRIYAFEITETGETTIFVLCE